ncbi:MULTISPECIES: hypothetical protein [Vibrio]|uniref:hypothetical protein n=1 Tax=Vibrio TaxID=662 RepID=UPI0004E32F3C|nr:MULTISPECIES: hypothetical protein [Vibrio]EGR2081570.1 oxidoreductase [Vibrio cholerae]EGR2508178.1 oxidoreductase [Vibrio cholerae]EGR3953701.1 oxidoreductase [Vibrio cholerae]EGR3990463.1 oxidoreductase [Vibrio cholerae]EGR5062516.1 oxidoreductase [Vibrio cholerae]
MDILSIATVLWYTVQPYLWLVLLLLAIFVVSLWVGKERPAADGKALILAIIIGVAVMLLAPTITGSSLGYVATTFDIVTLVGIGVGATLYTWLVVRKWLSH